MTVAPPVSTAVTVGAAVKEAPLREFAEVLQISVAGVAADESSNVTKSPAPSCR